jgi:hypothetical protein
MGEGIRPKGAFSYACLRSKKYPRPSCFGKNCRSVPDPDICETCAHLDDCKKEYYGVEE